MERHWGSWLATHLWRPITNNWSSGWASFMIRSYCSIERFRLLLPRKNNHDLVNWRLTNDRRVVVESLAIGSCVWCKDTPHERKKLFNLRHIGCIILWVMVWSFKSKAIKSVFYHSVSRIGNTSGLSSAKLAIHFKRLKNNWD